MNGTNHVLRAHEELLAVYVKLGMDEYAERTRARIAQIRGVHAEPIQLKIDFNNV